MMMAVLDSLYVQYLSIWWTVSFISILIHVLYCYYIISVLEVK